MLLPNFYLFLLPAKKYYCVCRFVGNSFCPTCYCVCYFTPHKMLLNTSLVSKFSIDRNCDVLPIEYDLLIVMFVNINITITIIVFFLNQYNVLSSTICYLPIFCLCSLFAFLHGHVTAILTSREWYASNT